MILKPLYGSILSGSRPTAAGFFRQFGGAIGNQVKFSTLSPDDPQINTDDCTAQSSTLEDGSSACPQVADDQKLDMAHLKDEIAELRKNKTNSDTRFLRQEATIDNIDTARIDPGKSVNRLTATVEDLERKSQNLGPRNVRSLLQSSTGSQDQQANARAAQAQERGRRRHQRKPQCASVDAADNNGSTSLMLAVKNDDFALIQLLISSGASLDEQDKEMHRALILASEKGLLAMILIASGASVDVKDRFKRTPLMLASINGHVAAVQALLASGAAVDARTRMEQTPLMMASCYGHLATIKTLLASGATVDAIDWNKHTSLMRASEYGHLSAVKVLIDSGATIDARNSDDWTPLMFAAYEGRAEICEALVAQGANIDAQNESGSTPLMLATQENKDTAVEALLRLGANPSLTDHNGKTALDHLHWQHSAHMEDLLERAGAQQ